MQPGAGSFQSAKARTATRRRTEGVVERARPTRRPRAAARGSASRRSIVAALTARTRVRTVSSSRKCPCCSSAVTSIGSSGRSLLPQTRSEASHSTSSARRIASSNTRTRGVRRTSTVGARHAQQANGVLPMPSGHGDELVKDPPLLVAAAGSVSLAYGTHQLAARGATDLIHRCLLSEVRCRNRSREATTTALQQKSCGVRVRTHEPRAMSR
jgi:hypothetical protein